MGRPIHTPICVAKTKRGFYVITYHIRVSFVLFDTFAAEHINGFYFFNALGQDKCMIPPLISTVWIQSGPG